VTGQLFLGVVCLALIALVIWREREHRAQLTEFADRLTAPDIAHAAAVARAFPPQPAPIDTDAEDDARFGAPLTGLDLDFIPFAGDA
jgi:hypothetical protein